MNNNDALDVINIGPLEQRKRRLLGIVSLTVGVGIAFVLVVSEAPRWTRLIIFFPVWIAGLGLIQARDKICIALAARGKRNLDDGEEQIVNNDLIEQLRDKARRTNRRALITAVAVTLVALIFP